jgi:hypothetical protein
MKLTLCTQTAAGLTLGRRNLRGAATVVALLALLNEVTMRRRTNFLAGLSFIRCPALGQVTIKNPDHLAGTWE